MNNDSFRLPEQSIVRELAQAAAAMGGRVVVVGGWVRDALLGDDSKDLDLEVFGLRPDQVPELLAPFAFSSPVGKQFPVWRASKQAVDLAFPRAGADRYAATEADSIRTAFEAASRYRDLTINAIGWDPLTDELIDPWQGARDLECRWLRAVSSETFGRDPLRVLRVARFHARFEADIDPALEAICRGLDLSGVASERVAGELRSLLAQAVRPSMAFAWLARTQQLDVFAPVARLRGVAQDPRWHPEGDVFVHTGQVVDRAAAIAAAERLTQEERETLLLSALCHDFGKPESTAVDEAGRVRSIGHEVSGAKRTREWLSALGFGERRVRAVETLVRHHLAPAQFVRQDAGAGAFRRLARKLAPAGLTLVDLERLARADHLGRSTPDTPAAPFDAGSIFLERAAEANVRHGVRTDVVSADLLMSRGVEPGPELGRLLARCREIQDETGSVDAASIADRALAEGSKNPTTDGLT